MQRAPKSLTLDESKSMKMKVDDELQPGVYEMTFHSCKAVETDFGECCLLIFKCHASGASYGLECTMLASATLTNGSKLGRMVVAIRGGQPLQPNEQLDLADLYGTRGLATLTLNEKNGRIVVDGFVRQQESPVQQAVQQPPAEPPVQQMSTAQADVQQALQQPVQQQPTGQQPVQQQPSLPGADEEVPF